MGTLDFAEKPDIDPELEIDGSHYGGQKNDKNEKEGFGI